MRVTITFKYKSYPNAPDLSERSKKISGFTRPVCALAYALIPALPGIVLQQFQLATVFYGAALTILLIALPLIRMAMISQLDKEYADRKRSDDWIEFGAWVCKRCAASNMALLPVCSRCGSPREISLPKPKPKPAPVYVPQDEDICAVLTVATGPMAGQELICEEDIPMYIGRDPQRCDLALTGYSAISALHCTVNLESGVLTVKDEGSSNGTWIGGKKLVPNQPARLTAKDTLRLAGDNCVLTVKFRKLQ